MCIITIKKSQQKYEKTANLTRTLAKDHQTLKNKQKTPSDPVLPTISPETTIIIPPNNNQSFNNR